MAEFKILKKRGRFFPGYSSSGYLTTISHSSTKRLALANRGHNSCVKKIACARCINYLFYLHDGGEKLLVLAGGPLTELAIIVRYCPDILAKLGPMVVQAGDFGEGNSSNLLGGQGILSTGLRPGA